MIFDEKSWNNICRGYTILDGTIGFEAGRLGFMLAEVTEADHLDDGFQVRFVAVKLANPVEQRFFVREGDTLGRASLSAAWEPNQTEFVMADLMSRVWSYKPKLYKGSEAPVPFDGRGYGYPDVGEVGSSVVRVTRVGSALYAVGSPFRVFQRLPGQAWREHKAIPIPPDLKSKDEDKITRALTRSTFFDLAGFSESDMYAVGDEGNVWHFDGKQWTRCEFPTNLRLQTVTCAGDGVVYITDIRGSLWKGRGEHWEPVVKMDQSLPFKDAAWFAGRMWFANDYGMYVLEGKALVLAHKAKKDPVPNEVMLHSHRIDVAPDGSQMLVCGGLGAALYDGKKWELLFSDGDIDDE